MTFTAAAEQMRPPLYAYCLRRLHHAERAEDAVQDTLIKAAAAWDRTQFKDDTHMRCWFFTIASHAVRDLFRLVKYRIGESSFYGNEYAVINTRSVESEVMDRLALEEAIMALGRIPDYHAQALGLFAAGYHEAEIGAALGITRGTVHTRIFRGRMMLRKVLAA